MNIKSRRLLVTGSTGFIGSHLTKALRKGGYEYRTFGRSCPKGTHVNHHFMGDVTDFESLKIAVAACDLVVHLACIPLPASVKNPSVCFDVNAGGTNNVARAVSDLDRELLFVSTSEVYGSKAKFPILESDSLEPTSTYGASKKAGEAACNSWNRIAGLNYSILRFFNIMGPSSEGLVRNTVETIFLRRAFEGQIMTIKGNRHNSRDFLYVDDAIYALELAIEKFSSIEGETINIGSGQETTLVELAQTVCRVARVKSDDLIAIDTDTSAAQRYQADVTKARHLLNFTPKLTLEQGLQLTAKAL